MSADVDEVLRLGEQHLRAGDPAAAERYFLEVLAREPHHPRALQMVGLIAHQRGDRSRALEALEAAARAEPDNAQIHSHLAEVRRLSGDRAGAVTAAREAARLDPEAAPVLNNLGLALQATGRLRKAAAAYQRAIELAPGYPKAHYNLGNLFARLDRRVEAIACLRRAVRLEPAYRRALLDLGALLVLETRHREALDPLARAARRGCDDLRVHLLLGEAHFALFDFAAAAASYRQALEVAPEHPQARANLELCRAEICDWRGRPAAVASLRDLVAEELARGEESPLSPHGAVFFPLSGVERLAVARRRAERLLARAGPPVGSRVASGSGHGDPERLRIGYLSSDFRDNALAHLTAGLYGLHDRQHVEVFGYSLGPDDGSDFRRRITEGCDHFIELREASDEEAARRIRDDGIHILVDLVGFAGGARPGIPARRPAPVQAIWLYPGTMGGVFHDALIGDPVATPPETRDEYGERLVLLPDTYQVTDHQQPAPDEPPSRLAAGLPETGFVFCSFNAHAKIEPQIFGVWMRLLTALPGSVLWLLEMSREGRRNLRGEAEGRGVDPGRLVFASHVPRHEHLSRLALADLALDPRVCSGHTTTSDALWAGVPVVTCPGDTFAARVSASLLHAAGHPELVARSLEDYEATALRFARDARELAALRRDLQAGRRSRPLFDTPRFVRHLERAYGALWERRDDTDREPLVVPRVRS